MINKIAFRNKHCKKIFSIIEIFYLKHIMKRKRKQMKYFALFAFRNMLQNML